MSNLAETLYYQTYNNVLLGKKDEAKMYLSFLREEYEQKPESFLAMKADDRWAHMAELGTVIDNNLIVKNFEKIEPAQDVAIKQEEQTAIRKQRQLVHAIYKQQKELGKLLNAQSDFTCVSEETDVLFGRVDIVAQDCKTIYPIEVKKNLAQSDVVTQIDRYILSYKLKLINRVYSNVIGVVIANSFSKFALQELSRFGAVAIIYKAVDENNIELSKT